MSEKIIETKNLSKVYIMGNEEIRAVDNVDFTINKGEFVSITGPSGSGKTTLLNLVGCIDHPTAGSILFESQDVSKLKPRQLDELRMHKVGFVFQTFNLFPTLTALENVMFPIRIAGGSREEQVRKASQILSLVGLSKRAHHKPRELSAGENQRVGIARALANSPSILLADEPTGNLDSKTTREITSLFKQVNAEYGTAIILISHDQEVAQVAQRTLKMSDGQLIMEVGPG